MTTKEQTLKLADVAKRLDLHGSVHSGDIIDVDAYLRVVAWTKEDTDKAGLFQSPAVRLKTMVDVAAVVLRFRGKSLKMKVMISPFNIAVTNRHTGKAEVVKMKVERLNSGGLHYKLA